ncbi:MAG: THUMP domain-containing protein [archaeon]
MVYKRLLLVKQASEISLKSNFVRRQFTSKLMHNIRQSFNENNVELKLFEKAGGRFFFNTLDNDKAGEILRKTFGVFQVINVFHKTFSNKPSLEQVLSEVELFSDDYIEGNSGTFSLSVNRVGEHDFTSQDITLNGSKMIAEKYDLKVDLKNPVVFVELREKNLFLWAKKQVINCFSGLPLGVEGKVAFLFEGKKEDLIAAWLLMKRGCFIQPVIEKESELISSQLKKLSEWNNFQEFKPVKELKFDSWFQGIGLGLTKLDSKKVMDLKEKFGLPVLLPLVLFSKEKLNEIERVLT